MPNSNNYSQIGQALSQAEFKGTVIAKLNYIEDQVKGNQINIRELCKENQKRKDWQENYDTRIKTFIGVATFVGGIIVFIVDRFSTLLDLIKKN